MHNSKIHLFQKQHSEQIVTEAVIETASKTDTENEAKDIHNEAELQTEAQENHNEAKDNENEADVQIEAKSSETEAVIQTETVMVLENQSSEVTDKMDGDSDGSLG